MRNNAQGALEYMLLIGGAVLVVAIILVIIIVSAHTMQCKAESNSIRAQMAQFEGLVGYWRFDEGTSLIKDYSYYENSGHIVTIAPQVASSDCPNDSRFNFVSNPAQSDAIRIEHKDAYYNPDGYTVTAWFKLAATADCTTGYCIIVKKTHVAGSSHELKFAVTDNYHLQLRSWVKDSPPPIGTGNTLDCANEYDGIKYPITISKDKWYFGAGVFDGTNFDPPKIIAHLYDDAGNAGLNWCTPANGAVVIPFDGPLYIGSDQWNAYEFQGEIDEVMWFNRPLSAGEIRRIYDLTKKQYLPS